MAQLVLLRSDFAALPHIVREGRRVIHNIQRSAVLFLSKNIFSFLISLILLFLAVPYPLVPAQISLVSALMIGAPSFLLTFEPACPPVRGGFLRTVLLNALPGGLTNVIVLLAACLLGTGMGMPLEQLSTVCAILMGFNGLLILLFLCWPLTPLRGAVLLAMGAAFLGAVCFLGPGRAGGPRSAGVSHQPGQAAGAGGGIRPRRGPAPLRALCILRGGATEKGDERD